MPTPTNSYCAVECGPPRSSADAGNSVWGAADEPIGVDGLRHPLPGVRQHPSRPDERALVDPVLTIHPSLELALQPLAGQDPVDGWLLMEPKDGQPVAAVLMTVQQVVITPLPLQGPAPVAVISVSDLQSALPGRHCHVGDLRHHHQRMHSSEYFEGGSVQFSV